MDLNLLVAFEAFYRERSVTGAGRRLGLSQPAASAVLARLRVTLGDELFVKTPRALEPTARAEALARPIADALAQLEAALLREDAFDPATAEMRFRVGAVDAVLALLLPLLVPRFVRAAPRATLDLRSIDPREAPALIDRGEIDLAICPVDAPPSHLMQRDLFPIPFVVAAGPDHPLPARPTLADLARHPHVLVSFAGGTRTRLDDAMNAAGHQRRVAVVLSSFLAVPHTLATTDAVAVLPEPFARSLERAGRARCRPLPAEARGAELRMRLVWPARLARAASWRWLREMVVEEVRDAVGRPAGASDDAGATANKRAGRAGTRRARGTGAG